MKILGIQLTPPTPGDLAWAAVCIVLVAAALIGVAHQGWIPRRYVWIGTLGGAVGAVASAWGVSPTRSIREAAVTAVVLFLILAVARAIQVV